MDTDKQKKNDIIEKIKATLELIIIFGGLFLIIWFFQNYSLKPILVYSIIIYVIGSFILTIISNKLKNQKFSKFIEYLGTPLAVFWVLLIYLRNSVFLVQFVIFYFAIPFVIIFTIGKLFQYFAPTISISFIYYIQLTGFISIIIIFQKIIKQMVLKFSKLMFKDYHLEDNNNSTYYVLSEPNLKFVIYSAYLLMLIFINFKLFNLPQNEQLSNFEKIILPSFLSYISLERAITFFPNVKLNPITIRDFFRDSTKMYFRGVNQEMEELKNVKDEDKIS